MGFWGLAFKSYVNLGHLIWVKLGTHHLISGGGAYIIFEKKCLFSNFCKKNYMLKTCT